MSGGRRTELEVAFLVVVLQAGAGLLTAVAPLVLAASGAPADIVIAGMAILLSPAELVLGVLLLRGSRRAAGWLAGYQALCVTGAYLALLAHLGTDYHLAALVSNLAIPVLLLVILLRLRRSPAALPRSA